MEKKCSKCGKPSSEVGRLVKMGWLGRRAPLCSVCRKEVKKKPKSRFSIDGLFRRLRGDSSSVKKAKKK